MLKRQSYSGVSIECHEEDAQVLSSTRYPNQHFQTCRHAVSVYYP